MSNLTNTQVFDIIPSIISDETKVVLFSVVISIIVCLILCCFIFCAILIISSIACYHIGANRVKKSFDINENDQKNTPIQINNDNNDNEVEHYQDQTTILLEDIANNSKFIQMKNINANPIELQKEGRRKMANSCNISDLNRPFSSRSLQNDNLVAEITYKL